MKRSIMIATCVLIPMLQHITTSAQNTDMQTAHISAGAYAEAGGIKLSYTIGQTVTPTFSGGNNKLTQGFQQPLLMALFGCTNCVAQNFDPLATADDGSCITSCSGDFDFNGQVNVTDLLIFMSDFGTFGACLVGDLNLDTAVNVTDLLIFMSSFGTSC